MKVTPTSEADRREGERDETSRVLRGASQTSGESSNVSSASIHESVRLRWVELALRVWEPRASSLRGALSKNAYRARPIILQVYLIWHLSHHLQSGIMRSNWPSAGAIARSWSAATLASSCSERPHAKIGHTGTVWHNRSQNRHPSETGNSGDISMLVNDKTIGKNCQRPFLKLSGLCDAKGWINLWRPQVEWQGLVLKWWSFVKKEWQTDQYNSL